MPSNWENWPDGGEWKPDAEYLDMMRRQMESLRAAFGGAIQNTARPRPADHRTPSPTQSYESLDHFLFQPEIHWNGQTVAE